MEKKLEPKHLAALAAALVLAGVGIQAINNGPTPAPDPIGEAAGSQAGAQTVDTKKYHEAIIEVMSDAGMDRNHATDLLTEVVEPGKNITASVVVDHGKRPSSVEYTGDAVGRFTAPILEYVDRPSTTNKDGITIPGGTTLKVTATNNSNPPVAVRLTAFVHYDWPGGVPPDAGVPDAP